MNAETFNSIKVIFNTIDTARKKLSVDGIQKIIDHFGIGKFENQILSGSLPDLDLTVNLYLIQSNNGVFLLTELPLNLKDLKETQKKIDFEFNLINPVFVYLETKKIQFAHIKDLYYSIRKIN